MRKPVLIGLGYFAFFTAAFILFFILTFDLRMALPRITEQAKKFNYELTADDASLHRLTGVDFRGLRIRQIKTRPGVKPFEIELDRLILKPTLSSLIALARAGGDKAPAVEMDFEARMGPGMVKGKVIQDAPSLTIEDLAIDNLPVEKIPLHPSLPEGLVITGLLKMRTRKLELKDSRRPDTWSGDIQAEIKAPRVSEFNFSGFQIPAIVMDMGTLKAEIVDGVMNLGTLRLQGKDFPVNLQGKITLAESPGKWNADLNGTVKPGDEFLEKMPMLEGLVPADGQFNFKGPLSMLFPGL